MDFPRYRPRRMRRNEKIRALVRETHLAPTNLIYPLFIGPGKDKAQPVSSMPGFYDPEPRHGWCYYFQKAELARQFGDWNEVATLADAAFQLDEHFNNPVELFVFIEGYAHLGDWNGAIKLSREARLVSKSYVDPLLCRLWKRIEAETASSLERGEALGELLPLSGCEQ